MGQKLKPKPDASVLYDKISKMLVPENILQHFEIFDANDFATGWVVELREKDSLIPPELSAFEDVVFDGYCNPIEVLSHSFVCKPVYLKIYRRRYKRSGTDKHFSNSYDLSLKGVKMVPELGLFLKTDD